jgi:hypothetical protein
MVAVAELAAQSQGVTEHRVWHLGIEFGILFARWGRTTVPSASFRVQANTSANHPAQHVPAVVPRLARTAMSLRFEMPNSLLSHTR